MPTERRVLVVDDEPDLTDLISYNLEREGYVSLVARTGRDGYVMAEAHRPDLIILDVMMPGLDGIEVARRIRANPELAPTPIIMLTARAGELDELAGLDAGADDYISKPFSTRVLMARVAAMLRRSSGDSPTAEVLELGPISIDLGTHEASVDDQEISLTVTEFRLLAALLGAKGKVLSRAALISRAMGPGVTVTERTIDVHITSIRKKLGEHARMVKTVRGTGYRLVLPGESAA